jgi:glycosyltransferase involved in cell wall biosynthesis
MIKPMVSIGLITYQHESYIHAAMKGILSQEGIEDFEIVVGDDHSSDKTKKILDEYASNNPNIRFLERPFNVGMHKNWLDVIQACNGKYIALIEGDDIWQDPQKLKKQVALLESDNTLAVCFSDASIINEMNDGTEYGTYLEHQEIDQSQTRFTVNDLCNHNFISTCTVMLRNKSDWIVPKEYFQSPYVDWLILMIAAQNGDLASIPGTCSTYRIHPTGAFGYSAYEARKRNMIKVLRCLYQCVENEAYKTLILNRYLLAIEELAQHLKTVNGKNTAQFYWLKSLRKLSELLRKPLPSNLV